MNFYKILNCFTFENFTRYLNHPTDAKSLAVFRIFFGFLMIIDLQDERAFSKANERWSNVYECKFPLFDVIQPLPGHWMCLLYFLMFIGKLSGLKKLKN